MLRAIHEDYIRAGADIVTANTFASARHLLERAGHRRAHRGAATDWRSGSRARPRTRAGDEVGRAVAVAGSLSTMRPVGKGTDQRDPSVDLATIPWAANLREAAELQAEAGADLLLLEMISDLEHGGLALEAALATGLPVWVGLSAGAARRRADELPRRTARPSPTLVRHYAAQPIGALGVMHTSLPDTEAALPILLEQASMPVMVYPEAGYFQVPRLAVRRGRTPAALAASRQGLGRTRRARGRRLLRPRAGTHRGHGRGRHGRSHHGDGPARSLTPRPCAAC